MLKHLLMIAAVLALTGSAHATEQMTCDDGVLAMVQEAVAAAPDDRKSRPRATMRGP